MFNPFNPLEATYRLLVPPESKPKSDDSIQRYRHINLLYQPKPLNQFENILKNNIIGKLSASYKIPKQGCLFGKKDVLTKIKQVIVLHEKSEFQFNEINLALVKAGWFGCKELTLVIGSTKHVGPQAIYNILTYVNQTTQVRIDLFDSGVGCDVYRIAYKDSSDHQNIVDLDSDDINDQV